MSDAKSLIKQIKLEKPLILNITNYVTMDFVANGVLSLGASPVMCKAMEELHDLITISKAVVINLGTLNEEFIRLCEHACEIANKLKKPIVLDPVGAGASELRTKTSLKLIQSYTISVIRGNASEIIALTDSSSITAGVDSTAKSTSALHNAIELAKNFQNIIAISGQTDIIVNSKSHEYLNYGSAMMPMITGTGCLLTAIIAAFLAVTDDFFKATYQAIKFYGKCGEIAEKNAKGPGTFKMHFIDALHQFEE